MSKQSTNSVSVARGANRTSRVGTAILWVTLGSLAFAASAATTPPPNQSDCLFDWAERTYPTLFAPARATSVTQAPYYYRYYATMQAYLATSSTDSHVYYYGPQSRNTLVDLGSLSSRAAAANCPADPPPGNGAGGGSTTSTSTASTTTTSSTTTTTLIPSTATPVAVITLPAGVTGGQAGYAASVAAQSGATYVWTITNGAITLGAGTESVVFTPSASGIVSLGVKVTNLAGISTSGSASSSISVAKAPPFNIDQALSDGAQGTTIAFSGFGMMTGNLGAQSFFPPGKVADYWGFQFLRDNDTDDMGHNTSFLTRISSNLLYILNDAQITTLKALAKSQVANINLYAWKRYPLMKAFRRLIDGSAPTNASGLNLTAIKAASKDLYVLDGQISYERAAVYADIFRTFTAAQKTYLAAMVGKGYNSWPDKVEDDVRSKTQGLTNDEVVAMMTYAGDLYSWYAGSLVSDVYFCPERHGTYFGSFYIKDAPAVGHPGYGIDETMTATVGKALIDSKEGYISAAGATLMNALTATQKQNLYGNASSNIVLARTRISEALRGLISSTAPSAATLAQIKATVDSYSGIYGELDGENNYNYATTFARVFNNVGGSYLTAAQKTSLTALRAKYMTVTYADGQTIDFSGSSKNYLFAAEIPDTSADLASYISDKATDSLFVTP